MAAIRVLHMADSHIGAEFPIRRRAPGPRRGDDFVRSHERTLAAAADGQIDLVLHCGDVFDRSRPNAVTIMAAAEPLLDVASRGVPVVIVPGNHERSLLPSSLFFSHPNVHVVDRPCTLVFAIRGVRVGVAAFPCIRRGAADAFTSAVQTTGWAEARADVNILAVHQTFESAVCGPVNYRFRSGAEVVRRDQVPLEFDYVAAGHVHRHQVLHTPHPDGPAIVYAGSPDRITFAERNERKGHVLLEIGEGGVQQRFVEHDVRPMVVSPVDVSELSDREARDCIAGEIMALPRDAVAQLRLTGLTTHERFAGMRFTKLARELRPDVILSVAPQSVEFTRTVPPREIDPMAQSASTIVASPAPATPLNRPFASAFDHLETWPPGAIVLPKRHTEQLPPRRGTYVLYDAGGRVLYVGKATNFRTRVASHLRGDRANFFAGWNRRIGWIEARPAFSDLEAMLVEADLIGRLRPPFNRQMRMWSRYCYVVERATGGFAVQGSASPGQVCFGPYRGMAAADAVIAAIEWMAASATRGGGGPRPRELRDAVHDILTGKDDALLRQWGASLPPVSPDDDSDGMQASRQHVAGLRMAFEHAVELRAAAQWLDRPLMLAGPKGAGVQATVTPTGLRLEIRASSESPPAAGQTPLEQPVQAPPALIPKSVLDTLLILAKHELAATPETSRRSTEMTA